MDDKIFEKVKRYADKHRMIAPGDTVVAGVSGGADSVCLFLMLCELAEEIDFHLAVVHVNHKIRPEAAADAAYVEELCKSRNIPFILEEKDVKEYAREKHLSEEEAGREVRYQAFEEALGKYGSCSGEKEGQGRIAVAHNANDRAETMLFHLFRGTGLTGAGGIRAVRGHIVRPLLCLRREEIEEYLGKKGVFFCIDRTNLEDTYTRNRIRNHILPFAEKEICAGAIDHMCRAGDLFLEADAYIRGQAEKACRSCIVREGGEEIVLDTERNVKFLRLPRQIPPFDPNFRKRNTPSTPIRFSLAVQRQMPAFLFCPEPTRHKDLLAFLFSQQIFQAFHMRRSNIPSSLRKPLQTLKKYLFSYKRLFFPEFFRIQYDLFPALPDDTASARLLRKNILEKKGYFSV